jgi:hypothetical protein
MGSWWQGQSFEVVTRFMRSQGKSKKSKAEKMCVQNISKGHY